MKGLIITIEGSSKGFSKEWISEAIADLMRESHKTNLINTINGQRVQSAEHDDEITVIVK